jgi:hypothetical protein
MGVFQLAKLKTGKIVLPKSYFQVRSVDPIVLEPVAFFGPAFNEFAPKDI